MVKEQGYGYNKYGSNVQECRQKRILRPTKVKVRDCQECQKVEDTFVEVELVK